MATKIIQKSPVLDIRTDCYLAVMDKFEAEYPFARFEVITRKEHEHVLSPSWGLLNRVKHEKIPFSEYRRMLVYEVTTNPEAIKRLEALRVIARTIPLFLVCYEKDANQCHRSLVKRMLERTIKFAQPFPKLNDEAFSTIRRFDPGFVPGEPWTVVLHDGTRRMAEVVMVQYKRISEIPTEFLTHDTNQPSRDAAIELLKRFYPDLDLNEILTIVRMRWL